MSVTFQSVVELTLVVLDSTEMAGERRFTSDTCHDEEPFALGVSEACVWATGPFRRSMVLSVLSLSEASDESPAYGTRLMSPRDSGVRGLSTGFSASFSAVGFAGATRVGGFGGPMLRWDVDGEGGAAAMEVEDEEPIPKAIFGRLAGRGIDVEGAVAAAVRWGDGWAAMGRDDDDAAAAPAVDTAAGDEGDLGGGCFGLCGVLLSVATDS